ncbi:MAG: hypothetical protein LBU65_10355 [Planctomycetaceae bacterium]|jgi:hypothetical protein|nr:hypothetical protein [Planctomycetaceae bacterium]
MLHTNKFHLLIVLTLSFFTTGCFVFADDTLVNILAMKPVSAKIDGVAVFGGNWLVDADGVISVDGGEGAKVIFF